MTTIDRLKALPNAFMGIHLPPKPVRKPAAKPEPKPAIKSTRKPRK